MKHTLLTRLAHLVAPPLTAERVAEKQLERARILYLDHAALAEEHCMRAQMFAARIARLSKPDPLLDPDFREVPRG